MTLAAMICRVSSSVAPADRTESINPSRAERSKGAPNNRDVSESTSSCKMPVEETSNKELRLCFVFLSLVADQRKGKLPARHEIALPGFAGVGIAIGRGPVEIKLTHAKQMFLHRNAIGFGVEHAQRRQNKICRAFIFWLRKRADHRAE